MLGVINFFFVPVIFYVLIICFFVIGNHFESTYLLYYTSVAGTVAIASLAYISKNKALTHLLLIASFSFVWFILAFRNVSGIDDPVYLEIFDLVKKTGWIRGFQMTTMEPGFLCLNWICSRIVDNYIFCQVICSTIPFIFFYMAFKKHTGRIYYPLSLLYILCFLYFLMISAALVRMFIAISIIFYAYSFLMEGNMKKYVWWILFAMLFHYSAGVMFCFLIFSKHYFVDHPWQTSIIITACLGVCLFFVSYLASNILGARYVSYQIQDVYGFEEGLTVDKLDTFPFVIIAYVLRKKIPDERKKEYNMLIVILLMGSVITVLSSFVPLGRIIFYFNLSLVFLIFYWYRYSNCFAKIFISFVFVFYCYLYLYVTKLNPDLREFSYLFPYQNVLFNL